MFRDNPRGKRTSLASVGMCCRLKSSRGSTRRSSETSASWPLLGALVAYEIRSGLGLGVVRPRLRGRADVGQETSGRHLIGTARADMGRRSGGVEDWRGGVGWRRGSTLPGSCGQAVAHTQLKRGREPELPRALEKTAEMGGGESKRIGHRGVYCACTQPAHALMH